MNFADYATLAAANYSTLKLFAESPLAYRWALDHPRETTPAMSLGSATHCAVLEPGAYDERYIVRPEGLDGRTKDGKAWLAEARESGREVLTQEQHALAQGMAGAVHACHPAARLLDGVVPEVGFTWVDWETGIACKGRADGICRDGTLLGLKTTRTISPRYWASEAWRLCYHWQWAMYRDGLASPSGAWLGDVRLGWHAGDPRRVVEIVVQSSPPHDVVVYEIDDATMRFGQSAYRSALVTLAECRATDTWPGVVPGGLAVFSPPPWAMVHDMLAELPDADEEEVP